MVSWSAMARVPFASLRQLWNARENMIGARVDMNSIMDRIYILGGINLIWF